MDRHLSPAETAKRFGVSIKALRVYEQHGLLQPVRTTNGATGAAWRVYGPDQVIRLHQILALKRLGLSLARVGEILAGGDALDSVLAFQERVLAKESGRITNALTLIRKARTKLASGEGLSIDDLATITQETVMTKQSTAEELREIFIPFKQKHLTPGEEASIKEWTSGHRDDVCTMKELLEEAKVLMASGDSTSAVAMDFARRFRATSEHLKGSEPSPLTALKPKLKAMVADARSDPDISQKIEVIAFVEKAIANLKAQESDTESKG